MVSAEQGIFMSDNDFDAIAGFDTSSITLDGDALQAGLAGIAVADAAFANLSGAARYANGVALIEAAAAVAGTSPVRALLAFAHQLGNLDGDAGHLATLGAHITQLVADGVVSITDAMNDFFYAALDDQITGFEGMAALLAFADNGSMEVQIRAGMALSGIIRQDTGGGGSEGGEGEGGGSEGGGEGQDAPVFTFEAMLTALNAARADGTLSLEETVNWLVGIATRPNSQYTYDASAELVGLANGDAAATLSIIKVLAIAGGIAASMAYPGDESGYTYMVAQAINTVAAPGGTALVSFQDVLTAIHEVVSEGTLSGLPAVLLLGQYANATGVLTANLDTVIAEALDYVSDGVLSASAAVSALTTVSLSVGTFMTARMLTTLAGTGDDLANAAGLRLTALIDTTSPSFAVPNWKMTAQQAVQGISGAVSADPALASAAVGLMSWMSTVPGGLSQDRHAMNAASDGVRALVESGAISPADAAAVIAAIEPGGLTLAQSVGFLLAVSASGSQQIQGNMIVWVGNPALAAAAATALADLIDARGITPADLGAALDALFPTGVTGVTGADDPSLVLATLMSAAATLAGTQADALADMGRALALSVQVPGSLVMSGVSNALQGGTFTALQAIAVVVGFAGAGNDGDLVAAGRELTFILNLHTLMPAQGVAQIAAAVTAGTLTSDAAILLLAGTATGTPAVGLTESFTQIAAFLDADPAAGVAVLTGAVETALLTAQQGLSILFQASARGSADTGTAMTAALLAWADGAVLPASEIATSLLDLADSASAPLAASALAALAGHGALGAQEAIDLLDAAVPASLDADDAITILVHMAAADPATLLAAVQAEINVLIAGGDITLQAVIADLQALQPGASTALQAVIDEQLGILITDPETLAATAGLGSTAQVAAAATTIAALFSSDAQGAQAILDALAGRIEAGSLSPERAASLLAQIYARGGDGVSAVLATMTALTAPANGPDVGAGTMADAVGGPLAAGALGVEAAFTAFGLLAGNGAAAVNGAVGSLMAAGTLALGALDAAVGAGTYTAPNAITVLGNILPGLTAERAAAIGLIVGLAGTDAALVAQALQRFVSLSGNADHALRLVGHEGIEALADAVSGVGSDAFLALLAFMPSTDAGTRADTLAALSALLEDDALTPAGAVQHIDDQLSPGNADPLVNPTQALSLLVALSAVEDARDTIYAYMRQVTAANAAAEANGNPVWGFLPATAITALANGAGTDASRADGTAIQIAGMAAGYLGASAVVQSLLSAGLLATGERVTLMAAVAGRLSDAAAPGVVGTAIAGQIAALSLSDQRASLDAISDLVGNPPGQIAASTMIVLLVSVHAGGAEAAALAELADIGAGDTEPGGVATAIAAAIVSGTVALQGGIDVLAGLAVSGADGFAGAVARALETVIVSGQLTAAEVMGGLGTSLEDGVLTASQALVLLQDILVARFAQASGSTPEELAVTAALQAAVLAEISGLVADGQTTFAAAIAAMAAAASGAAAGVLLAIGGEVAAFAGAAGQEAAGAAGIAGGVADGAITGAEALGLLVGAALAGGGAMQAAAGAGIAGLVESGAVTQNAATVGVYNAYLDSGLTLEQLATVTAGIWAADGGSLGASILFQVETHGLSTYPALAGLMADAVAADMLTAAQMVAGGAAVAGASGEGADGAAFLAALVSEGIMDADAALIALGGSIAASGFTAQAAIALIIALADDLPGSLAPLGVGLAELIAAERLDFSDVADALSAMLASPLPALTFTEAVTLLVSAAGDTSEAAAEAGIAGQAGTHLLALVGDDAQRFTDVLNVVGDAALDGTLPVSIAVALLGGMAGAGTQSQQLAVGAQLGALVDADLTDFFTVMGTLMAEAEAGHISSTGALFVILQLAPDASYVSYIGGAIDTLAASAAITPANAAAVILAAARDDAQPIGLDLAAGLLVEMAQRHVSAIDAADAAFITQAGAALASLVVEDGLTASDLLDRLADLPAFGAIPLLAAVEVGAGADTDLAQGAHADLLDRLAETTIHDAAESVRLLIGPDTLPAAGGLSILLDMAAGGGATAQAVVGHEIAQLLAASAATMSNVHSAILAANLDPEAAVVLLAGMIEPVSGGVPTAILEELASLAMAALPDGATSYRPTVLPLIDALSDAVTSPVEIAEPTGLSLGQAVLALAAFSRFGDAGVREDVGTAIAALITEFHQSPDGSIALLSLVAAAGDSSYANGVAVQIAYLGHALGLTAGALADAVVEGVDAGLSAQQVIAVLARLTALNPVNWGGPSDVDFYPHIGLAAGAAMGDLVGDGLTFAAVLDLLAQAQGVSDDNRSLLLIGLAGAGSAADQIAVGRVLAEVSTANVYQELAEAPEAVARMVLIGIFLSGAESSPLSVSGLDDGEVAALLSDLDAAVEAGALPAADALAALVTIVSGSTRQGDAMAVLRIAVHGELANLVPDALSADDALRALLAPPDVDTVSIAIARGTEAGAMIGVLVKAGLISAQAVIDVIDAAATAGTLTLEQAVTAITGASVYHDFTDISAPVYSLQLALGQYLGGLIEAGDIGVAEAMEAIAAAQMSYRMGALQGEIALLAAVASHEATDLQTSVGRTLAGVFNSGQIDTPSMMSLLDGLVDAPGLLSAQQAKVVLFGMAGAFEGTVSGLSGVQAVVGEFLSLIGRAALTSQDVVDSVSAEMAAGHLSTSYALSVMTYLAADGAVAETVRTEISDLLESGDLTVAQAVSGLFFAASMRLSNPYVDTSVLPGINRLLSGLVEDGHLTLQGAVAFVTDAVSGGMLSPANAVGVLAGLAVVAEDEIGLERLGTTLGALFAAGMSDADASVNIEYAMTEGWASASRMASLVAYAAGITASQPNALDYDSRFTTAFMRFDVADTVDAFDRAYDAGGIPAFHMVQILSGLDFGSTDAAVIIGPEMLKMATDGGLGLAAVIDQIIGILPDYSYYSGLLIGAMAVGATEADQIELGHAMGTAIMDGDMGFDRMFAGLSRVGLDASSYNAVLLAMAGGGDAGVQASVGREYGRPLSTVPVSAGAVDTVTADILEAGLAAGALTAAQFVVLLAGMGEMDYPSPYAPHTASYTLNRLVANGEITAAAAMAVVHDAVAGLDFDKLVHWLAGTSTYPDLHDAVAEEIADLADAGSAAGVLQLIREITGTTPLDVAALTAISGAQAAHLFISVAGFGDAVTQGAAGAQLALSVAANTIYLADIDAAVTGGDLSGLGALHVIAAMLAALPSDGSGAVRGWAATQMEAYVAGGRVDVATAVPVLLEAAAHASDAGLAGIGNVLGALEVAPATVLSAVEAADLTAVQAVRLLLGFGAGEDALGTGFLAARGALVTLLDAGEVSGADILSAAFVSPLGADQVNALALALVGHGSAADDLAIGAHFAASAARFGSTYGAGDDPFFTGALSEAGLVYAKIRGGQMSIAEGVADIQQYAKAHDVSAYAGLYALNSLLTGEPNGVSAVRGAMIDQIALGALSEELAGRVAEGTTSAMVQDDQGNVHLELRDPAALTAAQATQILNWEATLAFLPEQAALATYMFADDLWVAQQLRANSVSWVNINTVVEAMWRGSTYLDTGIPGVGRSTYAYDLALVSMLEQLTDDDLRPAAEQDYRIALTALSTRLVNGTAEDTLVKQYAAGNLTFEQVLAALQMEVEATGLGAGATDQALMHDMALAWLHLRARQYVSSNAGTSSAIDVQQMLVLLSDPLYDDDILTGYGALIGLSSSGAGAVISAIDKQEAIRGASAVISASVPRTIGLGETDQAVIDAMTTMGNGLASVLNKNALGRSYVTVLENPTDAEAYAHFGGQVGAMAASRLATEAVFAGTPVGAAMTATKIGAAAALYVISMGAVQDALGEGLTGYLHGQLTIASATASLIGDTFSDLGAVGADIAIAAAPHFMEFGDAVARGDAEGIASSIGELALDYYMLQTGVDPRLYVAVAERFGDLIVHLFTGDTGALGDDIRALGSAYLDTIIKNPYLAAIGSRMVQYAETINEALAEINDSYRILGENIYTGLLYVGTGFDEAGNVLRSVAHTIGDFVDDILEGIGIDGYISGATVFADANYNGVLDAGEASDVTDANGRYALAANGAPLILIGGYDTATNLAFDGTLTAPAGSTAITPLTTLIQTVASTGAGDPVAAQQAVAAALGLHSGLDLNDLDPIAATRRGELGAAEAFATASSLLNTVALLTAAGAAGDPFDAIAAQIAAAAGTPLDLTDIATLAALAAGAGVPAASLDTAVALAAASNALIDQAVARSSDPVSLLEAVTAVSIAAQGDTSQALATAGLDPAALATVLAAHTGANLASQVADDRTLVGGFGDGSAGGGEVPLKVSADGLGIELALDGGSTVAGNWVRLSMLDLGLQPGSTLLIYAVDEDGNRIDRHDRHSGADVSLDQAVIAALGGVADDHGASLFLGAHSVYLPAGDQLRFAVRGGDHVVDEAPGIALAAQEDGSLQASVGGLNVSAAANNALSDATELANAQRTTGMPFVFLQSGETLSVELAGSCANTNTLAFVRVDVDGSSGAWSVGGVSYGDTDAFTEAVRNHLDTGFQESRSGDFRADASWTVAGATGFYAPVLITQSGDTFVIGDANAGGYEYVRMFGENTFGFEDLTYDQGSDFDYNDMVMRLTPLSLV